MKFNKTFFIFFLLSLFITEVHSQNTFTYYVKDSTSDDFILHAIELQNGDFLLLSCKEKRDSNFNVIIDNIITTLRKDGSVRQSKVIPTGEPMSTLRSIVYVNENLFLLSGIVEYDSIWKIILLTVDSSFNILKSKIISVGSYYVVYCDIKADHAGNYLLYGELSEDSSFYPQMPFIYKVSINLDNLRLQVFNTYGWGFVGLLEKSNPQGYYFIVDHYNHIGNDQILQLDTSFTVLKIDSVPRQLYNYCNTRWITEKSFLITGEKDMSNGRAIGCLMLDTSYLVIHENYLGKPDTISLPASHPNLDFYDIRKVYIGGTYNAYPSPVASANSWYFLTQLDTSLEITWQKFYGGDKYYEMYGILATKDGGCMMYGTTYDWRKQDYQRDIFVLKVNKDGLLLNTDGSISDNIKEFIVFPNPTNDRININIQGNNKGSKIEVFDQFGRSQYKSQLAPNKDQVDIDISTWKPGLYVVRVIIDEKILGTDKIVKM